MLLARAYLAHKRLETQGCVISGVATAALVLRHQAISSHNADKIFIVLDQLQTKIVHLLWKTLENKSHFQKIYSAIEKLIYLLYLHETQHSRSFNFSRLLSSDKSRCKRSVREGCSDMCMCKANYVFWNRSTLSNVGYIPSSIAIVGVQYVGKPKFTPWKILIIDDMKIWNCIQNIAILCWIERTVGMSQ